MCLECRLLCPRCEQLIQGIDCLYRCLLKLGDTPSTCQIKTAWRFMTPTEMVLTSMSCTNVRCAMSVAQQLIYQSRIWHVVDILDTNEMEEFQAQAATAPQQQQRSIIRKIGRDTLSAPVPPVAGLNYPDRPGARAPNADTPENLLLHQALSDRRRRIKEVQLVRKGAGPLEKKTRDDEIRDALNFKTGIYVPSKEDKNTEHDNSKPAALEEEYAVLCCSGDVPTVQEFSWSQAGHAHQSGSPPASGSAPSRVFRNKSANFDVLAFQKPARKRKASSQSLASSTSTSAIQLRAALQSLQSGLDSVDSSSAASSAATSGFSACGASNVSSSSPHGSPSQPGYLEEDPSHEQSISAPASNSHDSGDALQRYSDNLTQLASEMDKTPASDLSGQQPSPGHSPLPEHQESRLPTSAATAEPSPSTGFTVPDQDSFDHSSPSKHWQMPNEAGQITATQPALQTGALTYDQPYSAADNSFTGLSGSRAQTVANMGGLPPPMGGLPPPMGGLPPPMDGPPPAPVARMGESPPMDGPPPAPVAPMGEPPPMDGPPPAPVAPMGEPPPMDGPPPAPVAPMDGPPPEPEILDQHLHGSGASEDPDEFPTQSPDNVNNLSSNNFEYPSNDDEDPFMGYQF